MIDFWMSKKLSFINRFKIVISTPTKSLKMSISRFSTFLRIFSRIFENFQKSFSYFAINSSGKDVLLFLN